VIRGTVRSVSLTYELTGAHTRHHASPLVFMVLRSEFDKYLLDQARAAGADVLYGVRARQITSGVAGPVEVLTDSAGFTCDCAVGADGANSIVARQLNTRANYFWQAAVYCEIPDTLLEPAAIERDRMLVDWGTLRGGYAWAFPKDGSVNVGTGGPIPVARYLRSYAARFAVVSRLVREDVAATLRFTGHQLPTLTKRTLLARGRFLLVGDAAGLVDPFTGDGISAACQSAQIASEAIVRELGKGVSELCSYADYLRSALAAELQWSRRLLSLSIAVPTRIYSLFRTSDKAWQTFCRVVSGQDSFQTLKREVLGPLGFASRTLELLAMLCEGRALSARCALDASDGF
jgi:flavin-dependent dehydrogenase